jgi:hypothetical protein
MGSIRPRRARALALAAALAISLTACGGGGPAAGSDPSGSVQAAIAAVQSGGFAKMADYVCTARKGDLTSAFGTGGLGALAAAGVKPEDLFNAMTLKFDNVATTEVSKTDTAATVHVTGNMTATFDKDKMRVIMKTVLAAQGAPTDDATLDAAMNAMASSLTQTQKLDTDMKMVNEGGKWLICN